MPVKVSRKEWNKKVKRLYTITGKTYEVGLHDSENARKGRILDEGTTKQVARPWFSVAMKQDNRRLGRIVVSHLIHQALGKSTQKKLQLALEGHLKDSLNETLAPLTKYTIKVKQGKAPRPQNSRFAGQKVKSKSAADRIGYDQGDMWRAIKTHVRKTGGKK